MCALLSITEYVLMFEGHLIDRVCWREFVCELLGIPQALYSFCRISCERDEWLSLRSSGSSSIPSLHSLLTWLSLHIWFEQIITHSHIQCFIIVILVFTSDSSSSFHILAFSYSDPFSGLIFSSHHHYTSHYQFDLFHLSPHRHYVHIRHHWVHGSRDLLYMLHFIHEGMGFDHRVFELSFPSFLSPYHPSLCYVPCLKTTLRPWNRISSSTASMWTGVWDSVDI